MRKFFDNGYGVSIVSGYGSYGGESGLFELAVLVGNEDKWDLTYDTPITNDVIGWLTEDEANEIANQVAALPSVT